MAAYLRTTATNEARFADSALTGGLVRRNDEGAGSREILSARWFRSLARRRRRGRRLSPAVRRRCARCRGLTDDDQWDPMAGPPVLDSSRMRAPRRMATTGIDVGDLTSCERGPPRATECEHHQECHTVQITARPNTTTEPAARAVICAGHSEISRTAGRRRRQQRGDAVTTPTGRADGRACG